MSIVNIHLVGDKGVGKSTYVHRLLTGEFLYENKDEEAFVKHDEGVSYTDVPYLTNKGEVVLRFREYTKPTMERDDFTIFMFDVTNVESYFNAMKLFEGTENTMMCGTKCDLRMCREIRDIHRAGKGLPFTSISSKSNYNFEVPILEAVRSVFGEDTVFV